MPLSVDFPSPHRSNRMQGMLQEGMQTFMIRLTQVTFWCLVVFVFVQALSPPKDTLPLFPWDKAEHYTAFFVLTGMALASYPNRSPVIIGLGMSAVGALIEILQSIPFIHRDGSVWDWVADSVGIFSVTFPMVLVAWRAYFGNRRPMQESASKAFSSE